MDKAGRFILALSAVLALNSSSTLPAFSDAPAAKSGCATAERARKAVHTEVTIKAPVSTVWRSMLEQRKIDPDSHALKTVNVTDQARELEQKFVFPSPFGDAECLLKLVETPGERVDFSLKESEDLKAMEGSWILTPCENGNSTRLSLTSYVEPGIFVPRMIVNNIIHHRCERNLNMVKRIAEGGGNISSSGLKVAGRGRSVQ
ncbi:MAG TPA: SRPBCC family protein [Chroococcales cyanobacterium]